MFAYIKSFFSALNANAHPGDIAHAVSLGLLLAFMPKGNLLWAFLFLLTCFIRVHKGSFFIALVLFAFVVPLADPFIDWLGGAILSAPFLQTAYAGLYRVPFVGLTRFNNTMVTGSLALGLITYAPVYFLFRMLIDLYRKNARDRVVNSKFTKALKKLPLIKQIIEAPALRKDR